TSSTTISSRCAIIIWATPRKSRRRWPLWRPRARPKVNPFMLRIGLAALLSASLGAALAAEPATTLQNRQAEAQAQQQRLRDRIQTLRKDIDRHEASRKDAASAVKASETAISDIDRRLAEL